MGNAAWINPGGLIVFIHQRLQIAQRAIGFGAGKRRGQMVDDHRLRAPLGLRAFAGIVDDEGIEMGQLAPERIWITRGVEGGGLAGQPFQRAVLAIVDQSMGAKIVAQPEIGGEIGVRRDQSGIVIAGGLVELIAAGGLDQHGEVAKDEGRQVKGVALDKGVGGRIAPAGCDLGADFFRQRREESGVAGQGQRGRRGTAPRVGIGRARLEAVDESGGCQAADGCTIARALQRLQHADGGFGRIITDAIGEAPVAYGIIGQNEGDLAVSARGGAQARPAGGKAGGAGNAGGIGSIGGQRNLAALVPERIGPVANDEAGQAPVDFGHDQKHRHILGRQALAVSLPLALRAARLDQLDDRSVASGEGVCRGVEAVDAQGKAGEVEHGGGGDGAQHLLDEGNAGGLLERGDEDGHRSEALGLERGDQRFDGGGAGAFEGGAVEEDRDMGGLAAGRQTERGADGGLVGDALAWIPEAEAGEGGRRQICQYGPLPRQGQAMERTQDGVGIGGAAGNEELVQTGPVIGVDAGARLQDGIGIGVAGQQDQRDAAIGAEGGQLVDAILKIGGATDEAEDDEPGMGDGLLEPQIDREIVGKAQRIGQAQFVLTGPVGGGGQHGQFAIGRAGKDQRAGALVEIDGFALLLDGTGLGREKVHGA